VPGRILSLPALGVYRAGGLPWVISGRPPGVPATSGLGGNPDLLTWPRDRPEIAIFGYGQRQHLIAASFD